jgi:elongation of very long chain fatty acids protein 6
MYCVMNYAVHAVMYFYYFLMAMHIKPAWFQPIWITVAQIAQMVVGVTVTAVACCLLYVEKVRVPQDCWLSHSGNAAALVMYGSYLILFLQFFWNRYQVGAIKRKDKKKL